MRDNPRGQPRALREFSAISETDAETGAHALFARYGLSAPIPVSHVDVGDGVRQGWPCLLCTHWMRYLLRENYIPQQMVGVRTWSEMKDRLGVFWARFRKLHPEHKLFKEADEQKLQVTIPLYTHTDEGRSQKQKPFMVVSFHSALGRGTRSWQEEVQKNPGHRSGMGLNFLGATWSNHFLFTTLLRSVYAKRPQTFGPCALCKNALSGTFLLGLLVFPFL